MEKTLGLLAGVGHLPVDLALGAKAAGYKVVAIGVVPGLDEELSKVADVFIGTHVGKFGKIIDILKKNNVTVVTMIGKVSKELLYSEGRIIPDFEAIKLLASLPNRNDDTIMNAIVDKIHSLGIDVIDQTMFLQALMPEPGVLSSRKPTTEELADMDYGFQMAKEIGGLDIGQTVVVKNKAVIAVEAIEGTDACIVRSGALSKGNIVAKVAKPAQDSRFDVPGVGTKTIESMIEAGCTAIVMEAGKTLLVDREKTLELANSHKIAIVAK